MQPGIESFLSANLHLFPQIVGDRIYFVSNLSGRLSLSGMYYGGSLPEPLLPPHIAMQNPEPPPGALSCRSVRPKPGWMPWPARCWSSKAATTRIWWRKSQSSL